MTSYDRLKPRLRASPKSWLITGVAGFIGSHLLEALLKLDQKVVGLDNFATGKKQNLDAVRNGVTAGQWKNFRFIHGDIRSLPTCRRACRGVDHILHQAALGSVPRSIRDPSTTHAVNVTGFLNMLMAARDRKVKRFVYASSSSVYGDDPALPKAENRIGRPLSPYAAGKQMNELYAEVFARIDGLQTIGLRYFNVFGPRQDSNGPYAAVIPRWITAMTRNQPVTIHGDGKTSRDFCYVENVVQANLLAATVKIGTRNLKPKTSIFNIAVGQRTTLNQLHALLADLLATNTSHLSPLTSHLHSPIHRPFRPGDIRHSHANISKARRLLGYAPTHNIQKGLSESIPSIVTENTKDFASVKGITATNPFV